MARLEMFPATGERLVRFVGDRIVFQLRIPGGLPEGGKAFVRTNLGKAATLRREIIASYAGKRPLSVSFWRDVAMAPSALGDRELFEVSLPLGEVGFFRNKAFFVDEKGWQHWPDGDDFGLSVHPDHSRTASTIYCAFTRMFGATKAADHTRDDVLEATLRKMEEDGYSVIPRSGTLRDLKGELPHILGTLGSRILHLLPVNPTPTVFAKMGRFGSPYAAQDMTAIDPALVEFDLRTNAVDQFCELADETHRLGGRLYVDIVINHTGWGSTLWNEHPEWFLREKDGEFASPGAWGVKWGDLVELEPHHIGLWEHLAEAFLVWCRRGVDGFRCDAGYKVPMPVWQYIVARVREEFPNTVFLLEGLGGAWVLTEALLTEGGMQWAYSELFQELNGSQVGGYLDHAMKQSARVGTLVHYSETHDNLRLAAKGRAWSLLRNRMSALTSIGGAYGFTCGVEWLADEKVEVHQSRGMRWGASANIVADLAGLNRLLAEHPAFFDGAKLTRLSPPGAPVYALRRDSADGQDSVLVLINTDPAAEYGLELTAETLAFLGKSPVNLLDDDAGAHPSRIPSGEESVFHQTVTNSGKVLLNLRPAGTVCLAGSATIMGLSGDAYRGVRARAALAAESLAAVLMPEALPCWDAAEIAEAVDDDAVGFFAAVSQLISSGSGPDTAAGAIGSSLRSWLDRSASLFPSVVLWTPADVRRVTPVPPGHWVVLKDSRPFRATLQIPAVSHLPRPHLDLCPTLHLESVPVRDGHIAVVPPSFHAGATRGGAMEAPASVSLVRFGDPVSRLKADWILLADRPGFSGEFDVTSPASEQATVLLTNGRGGMARMAVDLGRVFSKYDCLLGANLDAELPVDRHVFAKRVRAWINTDGFITALDLQNLASFKPGPPAVWTFRAHAGDERTVDVQLTADMIEGQNTVVLRFNRRPGCRAISVRLTLRVDVEDRSFHSQTEHNEGAEHHFRSHIQPFKDRPGFAFTPAADRFFRVYADGGTFFPGEEWSACKHPVEETRGQVGHGDAYSPGWFDLPLAAEGSAMLVLTAEAADPSPETCHQASTMREAEDRVAVERAGVESHDGLGRQLAIASRAFVVRRGVGKSVIAGYPWFLDWGRDTLIAARGLLAGGGLQTVTEILITFGRFVENGTLPNTIHGDNASNRDTSDAPLWYGVVAEETADFIRKTSGDAEVARFYAEHVDEQGRTITEVLREIASGYLRGTPNGIRVDPASALVWSPSHFTWMDTNFPAGTPRAGYPVEIEALWIRLLKQLDRLDAAPANEPWGILAERARLKVDELFWVADKGWFGDCLIGPPGKPAAECVVDQVLRSNMLFLVGLGLVTGPKARTSVEAARQWLVVPGSLRSLAPLPATPPHAVYGNDGRLLNDPANPYWDRYEGDEDTRRKPAYHNGTTWGWTLPVFCEALALAYGESPEAVAAARAYLGGVARLLNEGCLGQLPEIMDGDAPHALRGCDAQAWSVTEALRVWKKLAK